MRVCVSCGSIPTFFYFTIDHSGKEFLCAIEKSNQLHTTAKNLLKGMMSSIFQFVIIAIFVIIGLPYHTSKLSPSNLSSKRILSEWKDINKAGLDLSTPFNSSSSDECGIRLSPLRNNLLEWHFSFLGMEGSHFEDGIYHGKICLHPDYPRKAPVISVNTPSGRWETNTPICLSASSHHQELWNPNWNLRTLVLSLRSFMTTQPGEIASLHSTPEVHRQLARLSGRYFCRDCGVHHEVLMRGGDKDYNNDNAAQKLYLSKMDEILLQQNTRMRPSKPTTTSSASAGLSRTAVVKRSKKLNTNEAVTSRHFPFKLWKSSVVQKSVAFLASLAIFFVLKGRAYFNISALV